MILGFDKERVKSREKKVDLAKWIQESEEMNE